MRAFLDSRLTLIGELQPEQLERLRREADFEPVLHHAPRLSTFFLLFPRQGQLSDLRLRRLLLSALDLEGMVSEQLGELAVPARGLIPPGLLGHEAPSPRDELASASQEPRRLAELSGLRLRCAVHLSYRTVYAPFWRTLCGRLEQLGIDLEQQSLESGRPVTGGPAASPSDGDAGDVDLVATRWIADYADTDAFAGSLEVFHRRGFFDANLAHELAAIAHRARREGDPGLRHALYRQIEDLLRETLELAPLFHENVIRLARPELRGLRLAATFPEVRYEELFLDESAVEG